MKRYSVWLLTVIILLQFSSYAQRIDMDAVHMRIDSAVQMIANKAGYSQYIDMVFERSPDRVTFSVQGATVRETMEACLGRLPVYYRLAGRSISVLPGCYVWGRVTDSAGNGIEGATVTTEDKGMSVGVESDERGYFALRMKGVRRSVAVSYVGYATQHYEGVAGSRELSVVMRSTPGQLGGVVISDGFKDIPAERATGAFDIIRREEIGRRPSASVVDRLDGVAGSYLVNKNIQAGTNQSSVSIRGRSTIFSNAEPLVVVDNFPYSGDVNNINPEDIESISILKDAAAASVWGTRAANGVIVIRTKQGRYAQGPHLSFNSSLTVGGKPDLYYQPVLSSSDFIDVERYLFNLGFYDNAIGSLSHPAISPAVEIMLRQRDGGLTAEQAAAGLDTLRGRDSRRDVGRYFYQRSVNQQYWLGLSGGAASQRYALSAGLDQDRAVQTRNNYRRITMSGNHSYRLIPQHLELSSSFAFASTRTDKDQAGIYSSLPYLSLVGSNGQALAVPYGLRAGYIDTVGGGRLLDWHYRPLDELGNASNVIRLTDWRLNEGLHYRIGAGWQVHALYQYGQGNSDQQNLQNIHSYYTRDLINSFTQVGASGQFTYPVPLGGIMDETTMEYQSHNGRLQAEYHPSLGADHELHLLAGAEVQSVRTRTKVSRVYGYNEASQTGVPVGSYTTLYPQYATGSMVSIPYPDNNVSTADYYFSSYLNGGYRYKQRYTLTGSARLDQSNLFGVDINNKSLPLWSAGLMWEMSREGFYKVSWLPFLRLRATNGYNGNVYKSITGFTTVNAQGTYDAQFLYGFLNSYGSPAASISNPPNPHLRWEQVAVFNTGADFASKDSVMQGSVDYYTKTGKYLIGPASLDPTSGNVAYTANVAHMLTRGIDVHLRLQLPLGTVGYNSVVLFNLVRDKVTRYLLTPTSIQPFLNTLSINPLVGRPLYSLYALRFAGLDGAGNPQGMLNGKASEDYTNIIKSSNFADLVYQGPVNPPIFGSWRHTFTYKQWGLSFNIVYKFGHYFMRPSINYYNLFQGLSTGHPDYDLRWQHPGDELHTSVPSMTYPADPVRDNFYNVSTVLVEKADLIRLQDIQVFYDLDKRKLPWLPVHTLHVYGYANNVGLLWTANKRKVDPDAVSGMPAPRSIAIGFKMDL